MRISYSLLKETFKKVLLKTGFTEERAELIAAIFAGNSRDGVYSHGLNRFPVFINAVQMGWVEIGANPSVVNRNGAIEFWDGNLGPGMYVASLAMQRAVDIAKKIGMGCVSVRNSNHWMRGGTYGWQAADAGCVGICVSNTIANMPPWGAKEPRLGNNPLVIAIPRKDGHIVLDMALSQFSYGKMQSYEFSGQALPVSGGYNKNGALTNNPVEIRESQRILPIGFWKGAGLSFILDVLVASLSGGQSVGQITAAGGEKGLSQFFLCIQASQIDQDQIEAIIKYTKEALPVEKDGRVYYPGEQTLATRLENDREGIPVDEQIWQRVLEM